MPRTISPMLATLTKEVIQHPDYLYEIKWDGYRIISHVAKGKVRMDSRSALDYTNKYPPVVSALKKLKHEVILDGEVVVFNAEGVPDFDALQLYSGHNTPITYCIFDLLWIDGYDLMRLPLTARKDILKSLLKNNRILRFSESYDDGVNLYNDVQKKNLEGIIAKKRNSEYKQGVRGNDWLKIPTRKRQEFVIGGWAESDKARSFKSLLFGAYNNGKLEWIGRSGGGYKEKEMPAILKKLKAIETDHSPFFNPVLDTKGSVIHWAKPELVANFEFATWTKSGRIRKPATFLGFRSDKKPKQVVREVPAESSEIVKEVKSKTKLPVSRNRNWRQVEQQPKDDVSSFELDDCTIDLFNVDRHLWHNVTKADIIRYYHHVAAAVLHFVRDRPQSLHIKLNGARAPGLYIKDMEGRQPECADIFKDRRRHKSAGKKNIIEYLVCNNEATLLWLINLGCIDVNPWNSRVANILHPDYIVIDLDPTEKELTDRGLKRLLTVAEATKEYCDSVKLKAFVKTSGKTGLHFLVPCSKLDFKQARIVAENICEAILALVPDDSTTAVSISKRGNKVYIDPSQNDYGDTIAAPYCLRPYAHPTVSTPLAWNEVKTGLDPRKFTMDLVLKRLGKKGDLWKDLLNAKIIASNNKILKRILS